MKCYFAYGSNMWNEQMRKRCPQSRKIGVAVLPGYRWIITTRGYASMVESPEEQVEGVLFEISESDEQALDRFEGVASGNYQKHDLTVRQGNHDVIAMVYIDPITAEGEPKEEYIHRINAGLADADLSDRYITRQVRRFIRD